VLFPIYVSSNEISMRSKLLLFLFILPGFITSAQKKSYTDYYFEAKTLVNSLKKYQILIQAHGETYPFISNEYVKNEVSKSFNFLNSKKPVDKDPDFTIKIIVSDVSANVDYAYLGDNNTFEVICIYNVSFALSFETNGKAVVCIPLCTKKHYEKRFPFSSINFPYSGKSLEFNPKENRYPITAGKNKPNIDKYVDELEVLLNTKVNFIIEFNDVLVAFRKKQ
jgi:hypothetical protein